jgi:hypothetical protein
LRCGALFLKTEGLFMKKLATLIFFSTLTLPALAQTTELVNADASIFSEICIAAATSDAALKEKAAHYKFGAAELDNFTCNGLSLEKFAKKFKQNMGKDATKVAVFAFDKTMNNIESEICVAAATSNDAFAALKGTLNKPANFYSDVSCNDVPLARFAKKHGNKDFKL